MRMSERDTHTLSRPKGSQKPRGACAPISVSKAIFSAEVERMDEGAKADAETKEATRARARNIFELGEALVYENWPERERRCYIDLSTRSWDFFSGGNAVPWQSFPNSEDFPRL
jgi:hypothetical protein